MLTLQSSCNSSDIWQGIFHLLRNTQPNERHALDRRLLQLSLLPLQLLQPQGLHLVRATTPYCRFGGSVMQCSVQCKVWAAGS